MTNSVDLIPLPLPSQQSMVIDLDSGTVLGTNLVVVHVAAGDLDAILDSDSAAREYGEAYGYPLFADIAD